MENQQCQWVLKMLFQPCSALLQDYLNGVVALIDFILACKLFNNINVYFIEFSHNGTDIEDSLISS